jgi:hypothetical protein
VKGTPLKLVTTHESKLSVHVENGKLVIDECTFPITQEEAELIFPKWIVEELDGDK